MSVYNVKAICRTYPRLQTAPNVSCYEHGGGSFCCGDSLNADNDNDYDDYADDGHTLTVTTTVIIILKVIDNDYNLVFRRANRPNRLCKFQNSVFIALLNFLFLKINMISVKF